MKRYYLLFIAIVFLIIDIPIPTIAYPAYEAFNTQAPQTVDLVINYVIGPRLKIDIFSDLVGYLLLAAASVMLSFRNRRFRTVLGWTVVSFGICVYQSVMPFLLNGSPRFRMGYLIYFVAAILETVTIFYAMYSLCFQLETLENHSYNNVTVMIAMVCAGVGFVSLATHFFHLTVISVIYYCLQIIAAGVYWYMVYRDRSMLQGEKHQSDQ